MKQDAIEVLTKYFEVVFSTSPLIRVNLFPDEVNSEFLFESEFNRLVADLDVENELAEYLDQKSGVSDKKELFYVDIHCFQTFLFMANKSELNVDPLSEFEVFRSDVPFHYGSYLISRNRKTSLADLAKRVIKSKEVYYIEMIAFIGGRLERYDQ